MTPLIWSEDKPTKMGHYWWRADKDRLPDVYQIIMLSQGLYILNIPRFLAAQPAGQWSGPIPLPVEPDQPHYIDRAVSTDLNERIKQ